MPPPDLQKASLWPPQGAQDESDVNQTIDSTLSFDLHSAFIMPPGQHQKADYRRGHPVGACDGLQVGFRHEV